MIAEASKRERIDNTFLASNGKIIFVILLLLQLLVTLFFCTQKQEYHIDEIYSYILSNSYKADRISNDEEVWNKWIDGERFKEFVAVEEGERFSYDRVYYNNTKDAHPPLYYYLLHTICSLFPDTFNKWLGLGINIVLFTITQVVLYLFSRKIFGNTLWAVLPMAIYGGTKAAFDTILFIRMYMLLTLFTVLLLWLHYSIYQRRATYKDYILAFAITFLGTYTQYYFAIFAFLVAAYFCLHYIWIKQWKQLILYAFSMLLAIIMIFAVYPAAVIQITGSPTNNIGNEVASNIFNFSAWGSAILSLGFQTIASAVSGLYDIKIIAVLFIVGSVIVAYFKGNKRSFSSEKKDINQEVKLFAVGCILIGLTFIAIAHISGRFVYLRYVYYLFPALSILGALLVKYLSGLIRLNKDVLVSGAICVWALGTIGLLIKQDNSYLFSERSRQCKDIIEMCEDRPLIAVGTGATYFPTGNFTILLASKKVYLSTTDLHGSVDEILNQTDASGEVVFMVLTDQYWSNGYDGERVMSQIINESKALSGYFEVETSNFSHVYLAN